jgi:hypothetical protein
MQVAGYELRVAGSGGKIRDTRGEIREESCELREDRGEIREARGEREVTGYELRVREERYEIREARYERKVTSCAACGGNPKSQAPNPKQYSMIQIPSEEPRLAGRLVLVTLMLVCDL